MRRTSLFRSHGRSVLLDRYAALWAEQASPELEISAERGERLLALGDHLHLLFESRPDLGNAKRFGQALAREGSDEDRLKELHKELEPWLYAVARLLCADKFAKYAKRDRRWNLIDSLRHLQVMTLEELQLDEAEGEVVGPELAPAGDHGLR